MKKSGWSLSKAECELELKKDCKLLFVATNLSLSHIRHPCDKLSTPFNNIISNIIAILLQKISETFVLAAFIKLFSKFLKQPADLLNIAEGMVNNFAWNEILRDGA